MQIPWKASKVSIVYAEFTICRCEENKVGIDIEFYALLDNTVG